MTLVCRPCTIFPGIRGSIGGLQADANLVTFAATAMETTQRPAIPLSPTCGSCSRSPSPSSGGVGTDPLEVSNSAMVHSVHNKITCSSQQLGLPPSQPGYPIQFQFQVLHVVFSSHLVASILLIPVCKVSPMCLYQFQVDIMQPT